VPEYRGYKIELVHDGSDCVVTIHPLSADLPILRRSDFYAHDQDEAVIQAKDRIDRLLLT
jgi:hypothetical protein